VCGEREREKEGGKREEEKEEENLYKNRGEKYSCVSCSTIKTKICH
jgi:hypothetical protein